MEEISDKFNPLVSAQGKKKVHSVYKTSDRSNMSLACLVCHSVESPNHSFRSYSVSSSDNEGRCSTMVNCLTRKASLTHWRPNPNNNIGRPSAKVTPQPTMGANGVVGPPRLVRSRAVSRDLVRDWNFEEVAELER